MACFSRLTGALLIATVLAGCGADDRSEDPARQGTRNGDLAGDGSGDAPELVYPQTPDDVEDADLELIAESRGWTVEQARVQRWYSEVLGVIQQAIYDLRPQVFVGGALGTSFDEPPRLYIKGEADDFVRELVADAPFEIVLVDRQPYSFDENDERIGRLMLALKDLGFATAAGGADIQRESLLQVSVERTPGAPDTVETLLAALPSEFQTGIEIYISDEPVARDD